MSRTVELEQAAGPGANTEGGRLAGVDRLRGLAVLLMLGDHLLIVIGQSGHDLRSTVTRLAMPLFFLIGGHLFRRLSLRHLDVFAVGMLLPLVVPWLDFPNVLAWYAAGCVLLAISRELSLWLFGGLSLVAFANGYGWAAVDGSYNPVALWALMAAGAAIPRGGLRLGDRLPAFLGPVGRYPLTVYVGHALLLEGVRLLVVA